MCPFCASAVPLGCTARPSGLGEMKSLAAGKACTKDARDLLPKGSDDRGRSGNRCRADVSSYIALARSASSRRFLAASTEARNAATRSTTSASFGASGSSASGTPSALLCTTVSSASR